MNMRRIVCLLVSVIMLLSLTACGSGEAVEQTTEPQQTETTQTTEQIPEVDNLATYFTVSYAANNEQFSYLTAYPNDDGTVYVEYNGNGRKIANMDESVLNAITAALEESGLLALNGKTEWVDGEASGSLYVSYADDTMVTAEFGGVVPEEFVAGYQMLEEAFHNLMADIPEYVASVQVMGEMDPDEQAALLEILNNSGMDGLDMLTISGIPMDEYFAMMAGLSSADGILSGSTCAPMMMTTAYALTVVTVDGNSEAVCEDFEETMDWRKWVCVAPGNALIATKGDMVLCLMGSDQMYALTAASVEAAGWSVYKTLENPDM